ncbi:probable myosin-binding protein 4 [Phragmites australis]|uniref:probable myosin-binding protein 4 n=1 Tax=Phragmites australis TaxID=29695 RepID=UPI002D7923A0|nr:probable myosin-binding protein 4 [Phragmites australis]
MATRAHARSRDFSRQFWPVLRHALSECCLIIMLFVTALVSYSATRLARICRLRSPCILCSRLDRLLHGKAWFSEELVCAAHRLEISRLSYCQSHSKLANSDDLCERCLRSCTASVGKPGNLTNMSVKEKVNSRPRSRHTQLCSCCSVPLKKTRNAPRLSEVAEGRFPDDDMTKVKAMSSVVHSSDDVYDHLPYEGYRKLKVRRDSESEIHILDGDDDGNAIPHEARERAKDILSHDVQLQPMISSANGLSMLPSDDTVKTKRMKPLNTARDIESQSSGTKVGNVSKSSDRAIGHGLDEINWCQVNASDNNIDTQSKAMPEQVCSELPKEKTFLVGTEEVADSCEGVSGSPDEEATKGFAASANAGTSSSPGAHVNRNNSMKNSSGSRVYLKSRLSEIISARDTNSKTDEEVKTFLSQLSSARGFDGPWSETATTPRISTQIDEYRQYDATGMAPFLESNNSNLEPFDANATSEDEGESSLERLKQQAELNRKKMSMLYKELEAERSASAVAASEAMAMINRLQEEKAAMHMEALQYLRMMEEQADHDQEAIEKLNDLLTEREKEMLDLESELESYRRRLPDVPFGATDGAMAFGVLDESDFMSSTMFDFEDEKAKILDSLRRLEDTLAMSSTDRLDLGGANDTLQNGPLKDRPMGGGQYIDNSELGTSLLPREDFNGESVSSQQNDENQSIGNQKMFASFSHLDDVQIHSMTSVEHEVSLLNTRFKALEADQNFLRQILSSLNCSGDGVQCVQEITSHLRELRRIMAEQRDMAVL